MFVRLRTVAGIWLAVIGSTVAFTTVAAVGMTALGA